MSGRDLTYEPENKTQALVRGSEVRELQIVPTAEPVSLRDETFALAGSKPLAKAAQKILRKPFAEKSEVDILTTGELYVSHVHVRRRLNDAVGPMGWALRPVTEINIQGAKDQMYREYALIVLGRVVATAFGSARYFPNSPRMDFADTAEAVKSNALTRCCKDLGIASECWDREWCDAWREKYAVKVWVVETKKTKGDNGRWEEKKETVVRWRKFKARPLQGEINIVHDSPNQGEWRKQMDAWSALLEDEAKKSKVSYERLQAARRDLATVRKEDKAAAAQPDAKGGESRVDVEPKSEARTAEVVSGGAPPPKPATQHGTNGIDPKDRPFTVRHCGIVEKTPTFTLHKIVTFDGAEYFTFSKRVFDEFQKYMAAREKVQIFSQAQTSKGRSYEHVAEWKELKTGAMKK